MAVVAIDMDEVMADTVLAHLARYNEWFGEKMTKAAQQGKWLWQVIPSDRQAQLAAFLHADYLIDDNPRQLRAFQGQGLLF